MLDPKSTLSQEQMKERLIQHRNRKQTKINTQEEENKSSHIKRLRLRGDWSDTGMHFF